MYGPKLEISEEIHKTKYRGTGESFEDAMSRVADALKDNTYHYFSFRDILLNQRFLPAGRVQAAMGAPRQVTPYNCFRGDTEIITSNGVKRLDQCEAFEIILDGNGEWIEAPILKHGFQPLWGVKLTNGKKSKYIYSTANHDWIVVDKGKIQTQDLKVGDKLPHLGVTKKGDKLGVIHGLIYGDGAKTKDSGYVIHVCDHHEETYKWLEGFPFSETEKGRLYYFFGDNAKLSFKELPDSILASQNYITGFIRGLFLADGHLSTQPEYIISGTKELYDWLVKFGPVGGFYVTGKSKLVDTTNFGKRTRDTYNIRFDLRSISQEDCLKGQFNWINDNPHWRVAQVWNDYTANTVYCPVVETTRSFVLANGTLVGNCYVSGTIKDDMNDIMDKAKEAAETMRKGGGIGYDFSTLRPRGSLIRSLESRSSGPVSFMGIYDSVCRTISSAGHRRGAQMGVLRIDHPDIEEFVESKSNNDNLTNFNISVGVTDAFMEAVKNDLPFDLVFEGTVYKTVSAKALWNKILRVTWDWAEPGILFIDRINRKNNLWYCETIAATNPCGEQPLPPYGACLLGSFNLVKYIKPWFANGGESLGRKFDYEAFKQDIPHVVRAMDNVVDRAIYPLPQQKEEAQNKRRMGLGVTGVANAIEAIGYPYGTKDFLTELSHIMGTLRDSAYLSSVELALEKGPFPLFDIRMLESEFSKTLPEYIRDNISRYGIRNSHLLSVAPTGTISLTADNISSGIEPVFAYETERDYIDFNGKRKIRYDDYGVREFGVYGQTTNNIKVFEHVEVLNTASKFVDSACSKTCNVGDDVSWDDFKDVYLRAYEGGASGCTTFRLAGKRFGMMKAVEETETIEILDAPKEPNDFIEEGTACYYDPSTGQRTCE